MFVTARNNDVAERETFMSGLSGLTRKMSGGNRLCTPGGGQRGKVGRAVADPPPQITTGGTGCLPKWGKRVTKIDLAANYSGL
jgi:hypothetical protein